MKTNKRFVLGFLVAAALALLGTVGVCAESGGHQSTASVSTVQELSLPVGTNLTISIEPQDLATIKKIALKNDPHIPVYFQWRKNHISLTNQTGTTLTLQNLTNSDVGSYTLLYKGG